MGRSRRAAARAALAAAAALVAALVAAVAYLYQLPLPTRFEEPRRIALDLVAADGAVFAVRGGAEARTVDLSQVPRHLIDAVLAMEDRRFFEHAGFDLQGVLRAALANLEAGAAVQGGSTITQQLAKNLFLSSERSLTRKIQEVLLAVWLERRLTKDEILARYLDTVYLGAGAYGVDAASRRYFGRPVEQLSLAQAAMLAGLIQAPSRLAPTGALEEAQERAALVLDAMVDFGALEAAAARAAKAQPRGARPAAGRAAGLRLRRRLRRRRSARAAWRGRRQLRRHDHHRPAPAAARRAHDRGPARARGRCARCASGGPGRAGAGRRSPRHGRRAGLCGEPVQPRRAGAAPAGLRFQAVRLSRGAAGGHDARQPGR